MNRNRYPVGWNARRVRRVLEHYERQTAEDATAEDEAAWCREGETLMSVPSELVTDVRDLIAQRGMRRRRTRKAAE
jgi:hypothetical protein